MGRRRIRDNYRPAQSFIPGDQRSTVEDHHLARIVPTPPPLRRPHVHDTLTLDEVLFRGGAPAWADPSRFHAQRILEAERAYGFSDWNESANRLPVFALRYLAGQVSRPQNRAEMAAALGHSRRAIERILGRFERSQVLFTMPPSDVKLGSRPAATAKWYLDDSGLVCRLLGIRDPDTLATHPLRGAIFENHVIAALVAARRAANRVLDDLRHWTLRNGHSVTILMPGLLAADPFRLTRLRIWEKPWNGRFPITHERRRCHPFEIQPGRHPGGGLMPVFVRLAPGLDELFRKRLQLLSRRAGRRLGPTWVVHGGDESFVVRGIRCVSWRDLPETQALLDPSSVVRAPTNP